MQKTSLHKPRIMAISSGRNSHRSGFTLLELLVTIGLLVLLMSIFATIFQQATRIFSVQRGILSNDQRSRVIYKQLEDDLRNISFKSLPGVDGIVPFVGAYTNPTTGETRMLTFAGNPYPEQMKGYFYISENDPESDTDDVLQFTIQIPDGAESLSGLARLDNDSIEENTNHWLDASTGTSKNFDDISKIQSPTAPNLSTPLAPQVRRDHPDFDDPQYTVDSTMKSTMAEVSYFMRGTTLYRRQLLLRDTTHPFPGDSNRAYTPFTQPTQTMFPAQAYPFEAMMQPSIINPDGYPGVYDLFDCDRDRDGVLDTSVDNYVGNFYSDYDLSAHFLVTDSSTGTGYAKVHGSLSNDPRVNPYPLGNPAFRFGHYHVNGNPREHVTGTVGNRFIGRFTHEETSGNKDADDSGAVDINEVFRYPQSSPAAANNPMLRTDFDLDDFDRTGRLSKDYSGNRKGEDILMTNVLSFNVQVWDDALKEFVNLGHAGKDYLHDLVLPNGTPDAGENDGILDGDYRSDNFYNYVNASPALYSSPTNPGYGDPLTPALDAPLAFPPLPSQSNKATFDTWHPNSQIGTNIATGSLRSFQPPIRTLAYPEYMATDSNSDMDSLPEVSTTPWTATPTQLYDQLRARHSARWQSGLTLRNNDVILPSAQFYLGPDTTLGTADDIFPAHRDIFAFRVRVTDFGTGTNTISSDELAAQINYNTGTTEPAWPSYSAKNIDFRSTDKLTYRVNYPQGADSANYKIVVLEKVLNLQPLKSIKVSILFRDLSTDQVRQISFIESLAD